MTLFVFDNVQANDIAIALAKFATARFVQLREVLSSIMLPAHAGMQPSRACVLASCRRTSAPFAWPSQKADINDLQALAVGLQPEAAADQTRRVAEAALAHTERAVALQALDEVLVQLEAKLCAAIGERHRLAVEQSGGGFLMLSRAWAPSKPLFDALTAGAPPKPPAH